MMLDMVVEVVMMIVILMQMPMMNGILMATMV